jgi:hypothetical protein
MRGALHCGHLKVSVWWETGWEVMRGIVVRLRRKASQRKKDEG